MVLKRLMFLLFPRVFHLIPHYPPFLTVVLCYTPRTRLFFLRIFFPFRRSCLRIRHRLTNRMDYRVRVLFIGTCNTYHSWHHSKFVRVCKIHVKSKMIYWKRYEAQVVHPIRETCYQIMISRCCDCSIFSVTSRGVAKRSRLMMFFKKSRLLKKKVLQFKNFSLSPRTNFWVGHKRRERRAENTSPRGDHTETGLRTKPSTEQLQSGVYDLYLTCCLCITGKHLASSWRVCVLCVCVHVSHFLFMSDIYICI